MDWLSKAEKEEVVIQLYKENKSFREIATLMHMSFRDIGAITKKVELQAARERGYVADDIDWIANIKNNKFNEAQKFFIQSEFCFKTLLESGNNPKKLDPGEEYAYNIASKWFKRKREFKLLIATGTSMHEFFSRIYRSVIPDHVFIIF